MYDPTRIFYPSIRAIAPPSNKVPARSIRIVWKKQGFRKDTADYLDEFLETSSIHGLGNLATRNKNFSEYLLWILTLLAAVWGTAYMGLNAWRRYQHNPTVLSMEKDYRNWNTTFATYTLCPAVRTDSDSLRSVAEKLGVRGVDGFVKFFEKLSRASYVDMEELPDYDEVQPENYIRVLEEARFNFSFVLSNSQGLHQVPQLIVTENGLCYAINSGIGTYFTPRNFNRKLPVRRSNYDLVGGNPLDGEIFIQAMKLNSGYSVSLSGPFDVSDVRTRKISSDLWMFLELEATTLPIISSDRLRSLSIAQRKCRFYDESDLEISDVYSYNLCRMQCRARLAYSLCKCIPYFYKNPRQRPYCDSSGMKCLGKHAKYLTDLRNPETNEKLPCDCLPLCTDFHYLVTIDDPIPWPINTHLKAMMTEFPRTRLRREVIFGLDDFLESSSTMYGPTRIFYPSIRAIAPPSNKVPAKSIRIAWKKRDIRKDMADYLDEFFETSSIHGLGNLAARNKHFSEYLLWMLTLLAAVWGTAYIGLNAWRRYQHNPTVLSMERDYKNWNTTFATYTLCPAVRTDSDSLRSVAEKLGVRGVDGFVKFFEKLSRASYVDMEELPDYDEVRPENYIRILEEARFNFSFVLSNSQGLHQVPQLIVTENGLCYAINSGIGTYLTPRNFNRKLPVRRSNYGLIKGNPLDGAIILLALKINSGYSASISGPFDVSDVSTKKSASVQQRYLTLEVNTLPIVSSDKLRSLSIAQRKCRFYDESDLEISDVYSYNLCRMQCRARLAYSLCKCIPYFYKNPRQRPYCDSSGMKCLGKHAKFLTDLRNPETNEKLPCDCLPLCTDFHYLLTEEDLILWNQNTHFKSFIMEFPRTRLRREVIFGLDDFLVSLGGAAGLFLGCSVLSFVEILYFFTLRLWFFLHDSWRNRRILNRFRGKRILQNKPRTRYI